MNEYSIMLLAAYIVPGLVASSRGTANASQVWVVNLFLGWTFLGWVVALAMAFSPTLSEKKLAEPKARGFDPKEIEEGPRLK